VLAAKAPQAMPNIAGRQLLGVLMSFFLLLVNAVRP